MTPDADRDGAPAAHPSLNERFADAPPAPENPTPLEAMAYRLAETGPLDASMEPKS
jgi:hypothetical protein